MLTNKIFNASALLLTIKSIFAYYQINLCLLSNHTMLSIKSCFAYYKMKKYFKYSLKYRTIILPLPYLT